MTNHLPAPRTGAPTRVVVVDDHQTLTELVLLALGREPDFECVATASSAAAATTAVREHRPDLVLMDVDLGSDDGLVLTAELRAEHPALRVVVLTAHVDGPVLQRAARSGACALMPKGGAFADLLGALRLARVGELYVHPALMPALMSGSLAPAADSGPGTALTPRELDVLRLLALGLPVTPAARRLGISVNTCRGYVKSLLAKLGAHSQLEAVATARRHGLLDVESRR